MPISDRYRKISLTLSGMIRLSTPPKLVPIGIKECGQLLKPRFLNSGKYSVEVSKYVNSRASLVLPMSK